MNRKEFVKTAGLATAATAVLSSGKLFAHPVADDKVRIGIIGVGQRGLSHLSLLLRRDDTEVIAICDLDEKVLNTARGMVSKAGKKMPEVYTGDPYAWKKMLDSKKLDGIVIATPWEWHKPMIIGALQAGIKYVGTEVILGITLEDHWEVVRAAERYDAHVMMMENVCYRRDVMAVLNMVRQGLFGELIQDRKSVV